MKSLLVSALLALVTCEVTDESPKWTGFLSGTALSTLEEASVPLAWSEKEHLAWKVDIAGYGQSSPVVWGDTVYVTAIEGAKKEKQKVIAVSWSSGKTLWTHEQSTEHLGENTDYFSRAAPTPVLDAQGIIVWFEAGDMVALDQAGKVRWKKDLVKEYGEFKSRHGLSSSLAQDESRVYVWVQRENDPYLIALNKKDGSVAWKVDRPMGIAWSSPVMVPMKDGSSHLVLSTSGPAGGAAGRGGPPAGGRGAGRPGGDGAGAASGGEQKEAAPADANAPKPEPPKPGQLAGIDPATGKVLWELSGLFGNSSSTPTVVEPGAVLVGASAGREGGPSKEATATNGLVRVEKQADGWKADYVWRSSRATCGFCSPVVHKGVAYFVDRRGMVYGLDAKNGTELFAERLGHPVWATPFGIGDRVYFFGEEGVTTVLKSGNAFEKLASNTLWAPSATEVSESNPQSMLGRVRQYAAVAVPGGLLIRRGDVLYAIK
jgi:outer membrane protein assembly factor BamB